MAKACWGDSDVEPRCITTLAEKLAAMEDRTSASIIAGLLSGCPS